MSDGYLRFRQIFGNNSGSLAVGTATTTTTLITAKTNYTINVQRIHFHVTTSSAGKTWSAQDTAATPVSITGSVPTDTAPADFEYDFGPVGIALTAGKNFSLSISAAGAAGIVTYDAYMKLSAVISASDAG